MPILITVDMKNPLRGYRDLGIEMNPTILRIICNFRTINHHMITRSYQE